MASRRRAFRWTIWQKDFPLPGVVMFGRYQYAASHLGLAPHAHPKSIEICFLERGEQTYRVGGLLHRLRGNDQFFTLPGEIHDTAELPQERGILYWLILKFDAGKEFLGLSKTASSRLRRELAAMPSRHFRGDPECARLLGEIHALLLEDRTGPRDRAAYRRVRLQALLLNYLTLTIRASHRGLHGAASPLMQRLLRYIDDHPGDPVRVALLAQAARLSESRCKARFKREIGVPPAEFWLRKKIERAVELLKKHNVTEVAYALGFSSSQYFATVFKRYTMINPSQFRRTKAVSRRRS